MKNPQKHKCFHCNEMLLTWGIKSDIKYLKKFKLGGEYNFYSQCHNCNVLNIGWISCEGIDELWHTNHERSCVKYLLMQGWEWDFDSVLDKADFNKSKLSTLFYELKINYQNRLFTSFALLTRKIFFVITKYLIKNYEFNFEKEENKARSAFEKVKSGIQNNEKKYWGSQFKDCFDFLQSYFFSKNSKNIGDSIRKFTNIANHSSEVINESDIKVLMKWLKLFFYNFNNTKLNKKI